MGSVRALTAVSVFAFCAPALSASETATASFLDNGGQTIGSATLRQGPTGVLITVELSGLTPGAHGIHLHAIGTCDDHADFKMSKGHVNPDGKQHGLLNPEGPDAGDLPNVYAAADGSVRAQLFTTRASLTGTPSLLDADGTAIVVHAMEDDQSTQPIGGAGARVACGVVK